MATVAAMGKSGGSQRPALKNNSHDSSAMAPQFRISGFKQVIVGARISPSGDAAPRSGDLMGQIGPVDVGAGKLVLMIDSVVP